jgi:hypothetical protein
VLTRRAANPAATSNNPLAGEAREVQHARGDERGARDEAEGHRHPYGVRIDGARVAIVEQSELERFAKPNRLIDDHTS